MYEGSVISELAKRQFSTFLLPPPSFAYSIQVTQEQATYSMCY